MRYRGHDLLAEVKAAVFVENRRALFPDCPTVRGTRHVEDLTAARRGGEQAAIIFIVHREDADRLSPWAAIDPAFARALRAADRQGVRLLAYTCRVTPDGCTLARRIPVALE